MPANSRFMGAAAIAALAASAALTACGDEDRGSPAGKPAPAVRVVASEYAIAMPDRIKGGLVTMDFVNYGQELHEFALGRLERGKTLGDLEKTIADGKEPPSWLHDVAGVPAMTPGAELTISRKLRPGRYAFLCFVPGPNGGSHFELGMRRGFTVAGDSGATPPRAAGVIAARARRIEVPKVRAGRQTLELRNAASRPRGFELMTFEPGKDRGDLEQWFQNGGKGGPPATLLGAMQSIPPGTSVFLTAHFKRGATYSVAYPEAELQARFTAR